MPEIEDLHPNLGVFALKIGHQFSIDVIGLRHNSPLICYFQQIISILEKIYPNILKKLLIFNLFMTH